MSSVDDKKISSIDQQILKKYDIIKKIDTGSYGIVFQAKDKRTQQIVAIKKIFGAFQNTTDAQRTYREITYLKQLTNLPFIVNLISCHKAENDVDIYLVFECFETNLLSVIRANLLHDIHNRYIFWQLLCALKYIHSASLMHRDISPTNILINSDASIKLCDFGLARTFDTSFQDSYLARNNDEFTDYVASRWYRSPELLFGSSKYTTAVDMWGAGCILAELVTKRPLFPGSSTMDQIGKIVSVLGAPSVTEASALGSTFTQTMLSKLESAVQRKKLEQKLRGAPADAIDLISHLIVFHPNHRYTASQCLEHPYVAQFHSQKQEIMAKDRIHIEMNENQKFSIKEYRLQVYKDILVSLPERVNSEIFQISG